VEVDKRLVAFVVALSSFLTPFSGSSFNIALPSIGRQYGLDAVALSWTSLAYLLASAMFLIPFGKLADMYGRKRVFLYGASVFSLSSLLLALYPTPSTIILFRALQGVGSAMIFGTGVAILVSVFPPHERGSALGINAATVYIGLSVGPFLGGALTQNLGWRSIFYVNVAIGLTIIAVTSAKLRGEWVEPKGEGFDLPGSAVYSLTLLSLMYGFSLLPSPGSIPPLLAGSILLGAFIWLERRARNPVLDINLFLKNRAFTFSNLAALINFSATFAITFLLSLYLQYLKGMGPQAAGLIMVSSPVVQALVSPIAGRLSDRVEPHRVAAVGMGVTCLGLIPMTLLGSDTSLSFIVGSLAVLGLGLALFSSPNTNAIMGSVERGSYGVASSTLGTMRLTGQMLSMGVATMILAVYVGRVEITPQVYPLLLDSIRASFVIFFILCTLGVLASLVRERY